MGVFKALAACEPLNICSEHVSVVNLLCRVVSKSFDFEWFVVLPAKFGVNAGFQWLMVDSEGSRALSAPDRNLFVYLYANGSFDRLARAMDSRNSFFVTHSQRGHGVCSSARCYSFKKRLEYCSHLYRSIARAVDRQSY